MAIVVIRHKPSWYKFDLSLFTNGSISFVVGSISVVPYNSRFDQHDIIC